MVKKTKDLANQFSSKVQQAGNLKSVAPGTQNGFRELFQVRPLDDEEGRAIERLLVESFQPGRGGEAQVALDVQGLKSLTAEIRAIGRQGVYLIGERVHKARELLKAYGERTFSKWLDLTFGNRRTPYTYLSYFEFHEALPSEELRSQLKKLPLKAAYVLAEREGAIDSKIDLLKGYAGETQRDLLLLIRDRFPTSIDDRRSRRTANQQLISRMADLGDLLVLRQEQLRPDDRQRLQVLLTKLQSLI